MLEDRYILKSNEFSSQYTELVRIADRLRMYCMKIIQKSDNQQNNKIAEDMIIEWLNDMKIKDKLILANVIDSLNTCLP